jgi:hypothetical protein
MKISNFEELQFISYEPMERIQLDHNESTDRYWNSYNDLCYESI